MCVSLVTKTTRHRVSSWVDKESGEHEVKLDPESESVVESESESELESDVDEGPRQSVGVHIPNSRGLQHGGENYVPVSSIAPEG